MFSKRVPADDELFELLANARRRYLLEYLLDRGGKVRLKDVSREIIARETDSRPDAVADEDVMRVYIALHQAHVPALEARGIVEYDDGENVLSFGSRIDEIAPLVRRVRRRRLRAASYGIAAVVLGGFVLGYALQFVVVPEPMLGRITVASAIALVGFAAFHYCGSRVGSCRIGA